MIRRQASATVLFEEIVGTRITGPCAVVRYPDGKLAVVELNPEQLAMLPSP